MRRQTINIIDHFLAVSSGIFLCFFGLFHVLEVSLPVIKLSSFIQTKLFISHRIQSSFLFPTAACPYLVPPKRRRKVVSSCSLLSLLSSSLTPASDSLQLQKGQTKFSKSSLTTFSSMHEVLQESPKSFCNPTDIYVA